MNMIFVFLDHGLSLQQAMGSPHVMKLVTPLKGLLSASLHQLINSQILKPVDFFNFCNDEVTFVTLTFPSIEGRG